MSPASPAITTTPSVTTVTLGTSSVTLNDTAVLSGGYYETGTITFTLYLGSTLVDTETVAVSGNGTYTTPTGYTLPTTGTVTGTYQWDASYSGDTNNNSASENNAAAEQVMVSPASPAITTTPSVTAVTLGTSSVNLNDTAVLSGGYYETGTITFTLYLGSTLVDTETVSVTGNGSYTTPTGYTLPTTGTVTGTYQWDASYSGDTNNNSGEREQRRGRAGVGEPGEPDDHDDAERDHGHAGHVVGDLEGHGGAVGRLSRDRHDHVHALPGQHAGGHRDGLGQRQRQLHDADRLHAADDGYRDRDLPVGRQLQRRHQQQLGEREQRRGRAGDGEHGEPRDHHDAERDQRSRWARRR